MGAPPAPGESVPLGSGVGVGGVGAIGSVGSGASGPTTGDTIGSGSWEGVVWVGWTPIGPSVTLGPVWTGGVGDAPGPVAPGSAGEGSVLGVSEPQATANSATSPSAFKRRSVIFRGFAVALTPEQAGILGAASAVAWVGATEWFWRNCRAGCFLRMGGALVCDVIDPRQTLSARLGSAPAATLPPRVRYQPEAFTPLPRPSASANAGRRFLADLDAVERRAPRAYCTTATSDAG